MRRLFALGLLLAFLGGCSTYRSYSYLVGGHHEEELAPRVYRVEYQGNQASHPFEVEDYALLRSAELALEKGFRSFVILRHSATAIGGGGYSTVYPHPPGETRGGGMHTQPVPDPGVPHPHHHPTAPLYGFIYEIELLESGPLDAGRFVYDAAFVRRALRHTYEITDDGTLQQP